jgi:molybdate transport system ATP-binding protein
MDTRNLFSGQIIDHNPARGITRLSWQEQVLEVRLHQQFAPGTQVHWLIPPGSVLLHQRRRPSLGERENPVAGEITELLTVSGLTTLILQLSTPPGVKLILELPPHVVSRNGLRLGERIGASLVGAAVHLMP